MKPVQVFPDPPLAADLPAVSESAVRNCELGIPIALDSVQNVMVMATALYRALLDVVKQAIAATFAVAISPLMEIIGLDIQL